MGRIREKRWRYGMEAFLFLSALLVADMLLCAVWGAFAAVPELFRTAFCLLSGIGWFLLRCALDGACAGGGEIFDLIFSALIAAGAAWRLAGSFWAAEQFRAGSRWLYRAFFAMELLLFAAVIGVRLARRLRKR